MTVSKTLENLKAAFAGESQANRKYLAYAAAAEKEGHPGVAKLFKAAAAAETVHAHAHLRNMKGIGTTAENLKDAIAGETHEFKSMYPGMIADAKAEGDKTAERGFAYANEVEELHANLYAAAAAAVAGYPEKDWYVCSVCGYTVADGAPDKCPVCQALAKAFFKVD
jgi:rubrerythrin